QVKEVLNFSLAILPSVFVSAIMHTLSLVPTLLWIGGTIDYPLDCLFYYSAHSINCILAKLTLIGFHKGMRQRFLLLFVAKLRRVCIQSQECSMAPAADYLYVSIETFVNTVSLAVMIPCTITLMRTQGMHGNCKILIVTSTVAQLLLLCVQSALFAYDFAFENLIQTTGKVKIFEMAQNGLFVMSSCLSLGLVLERTYAVWNAAEYEKRARHPIPLIIIICVSLIIGMLKSYTVYLNILHFESVFMVYGVEAVTLQLSTFVIIYARCKSDTIPYGESRLKTKYQIKEVLNFSVAVLPSVLLSVVFHTLSLVPSLMFIEGILSYDICCLFYFSAHSLNCMVTKLTLVACHKSMRQRFQLLFVARVSTPRGARINRDIRKESEEYFGQMQRVWNNSIDMNITTTIKYLKRQFIFLSIETLINTLVLILMVPCTLILIRTQSMHNNCKVIVIASATVQLILLVDQEVMFIKNFTSEDIIYSASSTLSLGLVLERFAEGNSING
ncbi:hypothetical protein PMAYCL1PPCAC_28016, partial [Pristionchus mayeri]